MKPAPDNIVLLPVRRTYLDAARDQGVWQKDEEMRAEIFEHRMKGAAASAELERIGRKPTRPLTLVKTAPVLSLAEAVARAKQETADRHRAIMEAFDASGLPTPAWTPFLHHILFSTNIAAVDAPALFEAASKQTEMSPMCERKI